MLFSRYKVAYEKKRKIMRNMASVAELKKSFFAEIDKVENEALSDFVRNLKLRIHGESLSRAEVPRLGTNVWIIM